MKSSPAFPHATCAAINSIKDSSSHSEPVSRARLPGDSPLEEIRKCYIKKKKPLKTEEEKKSVNFENDSSRCDKHSRPFGWKWADDSCARSTGKSLPFSLKYCQPHCISKHTAPESDTKLCLCLAVGRKTSTFRDFETLDGRTTRACSCR